MASTRRLSKRLEKQLFKYSSTKRKIHTDVSKRAERKCYQAAYFTFHSDMKLHFPLRTSSTAD